MKSTYTRFNTTIDVWRKDRLLSECINKLQKDYILQDAGLSESFEVKVGLHQRSVLSPLLFAAVMDVVSSEARSGLPSELLYADDLVIMEQLGTRVTDWRATLLGKGLKVNAGKSKVMVGSSGGKMIVNSGKWPCGVCGKGVQANSVQCTVCKNGFTNGAVVCVVTCRG